MFSLFPPDTLDTSLLTPVLIGLLWTWFFQETLGWGLSGLVVPGYLAAVTGWLRPDALTSDTWRPVYAALVDLHDTGAPIDPVTVAWRIARTAPTAGPGPNPRDLTALVRRHWPDRYRSRL